MATAKYIGNESTKVAHRRPTRERCNADDIKVRGDISEDIAQELLNHDGWRLCKWCAKDV